MSTAYRRKAVRRIRRRDSSQLWLKASRRSCSLLSWISPSLSAIWAEWLFRTPFCCPPTPRERAMLARGTRMDLEGPLGRLATWSWGEGRTILLAHGWGGHAGRLTRYVEPLTDAGLRVVAYDAPGHANSSGGRVSLPDFTTAIARVAEQAGPIYGIVGHSLGATAAALAIRDGLAVDRAVFLSPAADPEKLMSRFARILRLSQAESELMKDRILHRYALKWSELKIVDWARSLSTSLLVFHDRRDFKVPLAEGQAIVNAWPRGELVMTHGLGHHKILRDPGVIARAVEFLAREEATRRRVGRRERRPTIRAGSSSHPAWSVHSS